MSRIEMSTIVAPYGTWESPLTPERLFRRPQAPAWPCRYRDVLYWIEARAEEGGRLALMRRCEGAVPECVTPDGFNLRSRVHEYGGRCHAIGNGLVYFSNYADGRLYQQPLDPGFGPTALPAVVTAAGDVAPSADLVLSPDGRLLLAVAEVDDGDGRTADRIVAWPLDEHGDAGAPVVLEAGRDFYAGLCVSADARRIGWMAWDHPHMPWDVSEAWVAGLSGAPPAVHGARRVAGGESDSVCQLAFAPDGTLVFARDTGAVNGRGVDPRAWWNLYRWRGEGVEPLTAEQAEYGAPHWQFGEQRHVALDDGALVAVRTAQGHDQLVCVADGAVSACAAGFNGFWHLHASPRGQAQEVLAVAAAAELEPCLVRIEPGAGVLPVTVLLRQDALLDPQNISRAEALTWPTADGGCAHGWFYRPRNARFTAAEGTRAPLLVLVHGGPTARATPWLDLARQYWTTRGFAVLDVNHRGSTGFGRAYRQALNGRWGELDVSDVADGIRYLAGRDMIDADAVFIRGGSAGGYVVLRALTRYPQLFRGGACYYGIGELGTLARITHRFEAGYIETLLGEAYEPDRAREPDSVYRTRSPVNDLDRLSCPMILFQGAEDRVTPPELSRDIAARLARKGIAHEYVEYPGEGHGFRRAETRIDSLERETRFYLQCMRR